MIERTLLKLEARLNTGPNDDRQNELEVEQGRLRGELARLTTALASGGSLDSLLAAIREREARLGTIERALTQARAEQTLERLSVSAIMVEARRRLTNWQAVLMQESAQARQMLRTLLRGRLVFTPISSGTRASTRVRGTCPRCCRGR